MKYSILLACGLVIICLPLHGAVRDSGGFRLTELVAARASQESCMSDHDLAESLAALSSPSSKPESHREVLLASARKSPKCRAQVVAALIGAMDKPGLNLEQDQRAFFLWHYGGEVLGALRASEALDLLIANLAATDGESPSMTHYPAIETVIRIGPSSLPKLRQKLQQEQNANMRKLAVFCIASIGGPSAKQALAEALPKENDTCVNGFIQFTLKSFDNTRRPNHVRSEDVVKWFSAFYCIG